jgi:uncharacterized protein with HEPN domain
MKYSDGITVKTFSTRTERSAAVMWSLYELSERATRMLFAQMNVIDGIDLAEFQALQGNLMTEHVGLDVPALYKACTERVPKLVALMESAFVGWGITSAEWDDVETTLDAASALMIELTAHDYDTSELHKLVLKIGASVPESTRDEYDTDNPYELAAMHFPRWHEAQLRLKG